MKYTLLKHLAPICLLLTCTTLFGCTPDKTPQTAALSTPKIAESQRAALDKANAISKQLEQQAVQQQQQIDQQNN